MMEDELRKVQNLLSKYRQEHLLYFYEELSESQKEILVKQLLSIDFEQISTLYEISKSEASEDIEAISPLSYTIKEKISSTDSIFYTSLGENIIREGKLAIVTMAGGQGSRLGYKGPKGTFELDVIPKRSLFELLCENLKKINAKYSITLPWYIMTSKENHEATVSFFENKNYFDYGKENILFFSQDSLPLISTAGKLILAETYLAKEASNGNGNVFDAMQKHGILEDMKKRNIQILSIGGVDNVLLKPADPIFIGLMLASGHSIASKSILKEDSNNKEWVFARKNGRPSIVECEDFTEEMFTITDTNGNYLYRDINVLSHLFTIDAAEQISKQTLPYHRAFKKNAFVNEEGMKQVPDSPNTFKFETFVFDAFSFFNEMTLLRVNRKEEFAPIKDFNGPNNPEVAKYLYEKNRLDSI